MKVIEQYIKQIIQYILKRFILASYPVLWELTVTNNTENLISATLHLC
jgi:hypothetical protein